MLLSALAFAALGPGPDSGLKLGEFIPAYEPTHVSGPDYGTQVCPVCKYTTLPAVQVWVNGDSDENVNRVVKSLDQQVRRSRHKFKAFVIVLLDPAKGLSAEAVKAKWDKAYKRVAIAYLPPDSPAVKDYAFNLDPRVKNTAFVYKDMKLKSKFVNLDGSKLTGFKRAMGQVDR